MLLDNIQYNLYDWIFAVSKRSGCSTSTKPLRKKILFQTFLKNAHLFCKETTNQPQPQGLNPNKQAKITAWHTKPCKSIQRPPKAGFCCIAFWWSLIWSSNDRRIRVSISEQTCAQNMPQIPEPYTWHEGWLSQCWSYQAHNDGLEFIYETFESQHFITRRSSP